MTSIDLDFEPKKSITEALKPITDRLTREPSEHPDRLPPDSKTHPVTRGRAARRERVGAD
ncbi:MAG TPA: hypothetical protein VFN64_08355 [Burkholderiaceae bacterium]|nr:hypothetical protein [Burkholderiaceae bacterium]